MGVRCAVSVSKLKKCCDETKHQGAKHDNGPKPKSHKGTWPSWPWISGLVLSMFEIAGKRSLLDWKGMLRLYTNGYWISIYRYSFVDIFRRLQVCVCDVCVCVVSCRCIASVCKYCTSEYINKFNQMQEDVVQLAVRRNRTYRGNDDYTVVAVFKQLRRNNSQTNIKMPKDTPSMQKASHGNSEWILSCLTLDLPIFQFRLQFKGWLPVVEHTCWRKAVINFKLTGAEREIFLLDHLISKFVIGQTGIRHGILPCQK